MVKAHPDYILLFVVLVLLSLGLVMVFSASPTMALRLGDSYYYLKRHLLYILLGLGAFWIGFKIDYTALRRWALPGLLFSIGLLLLIFIPGIGKEVGGALRWINLGFFSFQPSEIAKFALVLFLAHAIVNKAEKIKSFWEGLFPLVLMVTALIFIILRQPDIGTTLVIVGSALLMFFAGGAKFSHLALLTILGLGILFPMTWFSPYRRRRIIAYLNPWNDPRNVGFHIIQSLLAVGSGGLLGLGLGESRQKFFYLPQQFTDFIYAVLCEELGFVGAVAVIALFALFVARGLRIAKVSPDRFSSLLAVGITGWIALQAFINICVVLGLIPTTGLPLPFISYGGTSLIVALFSTGILLNISQYRAGTGEAGK